MYEIYSKHEDRNEKLCFEIIRTRRDLQIHETIKSCARQTQSRGKVLTQNAKNCCFSKYWNNIENMIERKWYANTGGHGAWNQSEAAKFGEKKRGEPHMMKII